MSSAQREKSGSQSRSGDGPRERVLVGLPVTERRLELAGVSTAVLEGGAGPPMVLLHGPGAYGAAWLRVIPDLVTAHRVVAPDLPGQGASTVVTGALGVDRVVAWVAELIERTCASPPVLVGHTLGGAIAARFASENGERLSRLVLVDSLGLTTFEPAPAFGAALMGFLAQPTPETHDDLWQQCSFDFARLRQALGSRSDAMTAYNLELARTPAVAEAGGELMELFAMPAIPREALGRIAVPTTVIWGRHDLATPLRVAEAACARYGWPLHVIEDAADDPTLDQPEAFLRVLDEGGR